MSGPMMTYFTHAIGSGHTRPYRDSEMKYALETLAIEKSRLIVAIREMRSLPVSDGDYPTARIDEHQRLIEELEAAINVVNDAVEARQVQSELRSKEWWAARPKYQSPPQGPPAEPDVSNEPV